MITRGGVRVNKMSLGLTFVSVGITDFSNGKAHCGAIAPPLGVG